MTHTPRLIVLFDIDLTLIDSAIAETKAQFDAGQLPKSHWFDWKREQDELKAAEQEKIGVRKTTNA